MNALLNRNRSTQQIFALSHTLGKCPQLSTASYATAKSFTSFSAKNHIGQKKIQLNLKSQLLFKRFYAKPESQQDNNAYSSTLQLPKTAFSLRANAAQREKQFRKKISEDTYKWQLSNNNGEYYILHDGPPYANGELHIGHFLNKTLKDIFNRYHILQGRKVMYVPGWDCHGLPIELKAIEALKSAAENMDPKVLRKHARNLALSTVKKQKKDFQEWGIIGDWENPYLTLSVDYEVRELEVFKELLKSGYIFRKNSPVHWSPSSKTALAESELEYQDDYVSKSVYTKFKSDISVNQKFGIDNSKKVFYLIWTTTPWTLPANRAIAVNPDLEYTIIANKNENGSEEYYIVAKALSHSVVDMLGSGAYVLDASTVLGKDLVAQKYTHCFSNESHPVLAADYVEPKTGTGLVHTAPGHGKDDYELCTTQGILPFSPVDDLGNFTREAGPQLCGKFVLGEGSKQVVELLKEKNLIAFQKDFIHSYPIDWRTKKPIITRSTPQWFIDISELQKQTLEYLKDVKMHPESSRRRLESFVASRSQWCISRQRPWGTPIPVLYEAETDKPLLTEASIDHIIKKFKEGNGSNTWWELSADELLADKYKSNGKTYYKKYDTMDVWLDSGTSWTLLRDRLNLKDEKVVADLYLEGSDQHRGWFQSSLLTSSAIQKVAPYKNLFTHGFLLDENGFKMSKSIGNTVLPSSVINGTNDNSSNQQGYGVDVLRLWVGLHDSSGDIQIGPNIIANMSQIMRKLRGTFRFLLGNLNEFRLDSLVPYNSLLPADKYTLHELYETVALVENSFESHVFYQGVQSLVSFVNSTLSAMYFDSIKDRLYADEKLSLSRLSAQTTCHHILVNLLTALSPITPHFTQEVFEFYKKDHKQYDSYFSIFQMKYNNCADEWKNPTLAKDWDVIRKIKGAVNQAIEALRQQKAVGGSLEASAHLYVNKESEAYKTLKTNEDQLENALIVSGVYIYDIGQYEPSANTSLELADSSFTEILLNEGSKDKCIVVAKKSLNHKCPRCWKHVSAATNSLCTRCSFALSTFNN